MGSLNRLFGLGDPAAEAKRVADKSNAGGPTAKGGKGVMSRAQHNKVKHIAKHADVRRYDMTAEGMKVVYVDSNNTRHEVMIDSNGTPTSHTTY